MTRRQREAARRKRQAEDDALLRDALPELAECPECFTIFALPDEVCPYCGTPAA